MSLWVPGEKDASHGHRNTPHGASATFSSRVTFAVEQSGIIRAQETLAVGVGTGR